MEKKHEQQVKSPAPKTGRTGVRMSNLGGWRVDVWDNDGDRLAGSEVMLERPKWGDLDHLVRKYLGADARRTR